MSNTPLYIHIGTWKTGSTTIQYNLNLFKEKLKTENIIYLSENDKIVTDDRIIRNFEKVEDDYVAGSRKKLKEIIQRYEGHNFKLVASAEEFSGDPFTGFNNVSAVAQNLKEITAGLNLDIKIIVYLRRQDDFVESLYTQSIHLGMTHTFEEFLSTFDGDSFNWKNLVSSYSKLFGEQNIIVRRYHKKYLPNQNSLIHDFGNILGSKLLTEFEATHSKNKGYSRDTLEIMRLVNKELGDDRFQIRKLFRASNTKKPFEKYAFFDGSERKSFYSQYVESNDYIAANYLTPQETSLFPAPVMSENPPVYPGLTPEGVAVNLSRALLAVSENAKKENRKTAKINRNRFFRYRIRDKISNALSRYPTLKEKIRRFMK